MAKKQTSLLSFWSASSQGPVKEPAIESVEEPAVESVEEPVVESVEEPVVESVEDSPSSAIEDEITKAIDQVDQATMPMTSETSGCSSVCCSDETKAYHPTDKFTLQALKTKGRSFQSSWFKQFPWISVCVNRKKVFCIYCKHAKKHELFTFSKCGEKTFTDSGFQNWKKAVAKFKDHDSSHFHQEAKLKWIAQEQPTITTQLIAQQNKLQQNRRAGLLKQLRGIQYLTRQGVALQGHQQEDGNSLSVVGYLES